ncbi:MAG: hypothetical protein K1Y01_07755 [Vicinamibacteria bacterium]|nr:hypothetical protein [Vicinamibacteria bacterium]
MSKIMDYAAADARLTALARGLPDTVGGVVELGHRVTREPNAEELLGVLVIQGSVSKIKAANPPKGNHPSGN